MLGVLAEEEAGEGGDPDGEEEGDGEVDDEGVEAFVWGERWEHGMGIPVEN